MDLPPPIRTWALLVLGLTGCGTAPSTPRDDAAPVDLAVADLRPDAAAPDAAAPDAAAPDAGAPDTGAPDDAGAPDADPTDSLAPDLQPAAPPGCIQGTFTAYYGNFHAHTSYSDGKLTPADAFKHARDVAKLDIMVMTDHLEQLYLPAPDNRYSKCNAAAAAAATSTFLADCGFEYGSGFNLLLLASTGHNNVFFSKALFPAVQLDFHAFYKSLVGCAACIGQFNHPGSEKYQTWNNFQYDASTDARMTLFEFNSSAAWELYFKALDAGWHVSPMYNQDNHSADWGTKNDRRSGLFMSKLDATALRAAMLERRTFSTTDKNAAVKALADNLCWMGSILTKTSSIKLTVEATDADATEGFGKVRIYGKGKVELANHDCLKANPCTASFTVKASQSPYVLPRLEQVDGDVLVGAPIWLSP